MRILNTEGIIQRNGKLSAGGGYISFLFRIGANLACTFLKGPIGQKVKEIQDLLTVWHNIWP